MITRSLVHDILAYQVGLIVVDGMRYLFKKGIYLFYGIMLLQLHICLFVLVCPNEEKSLAVFVGIYSGRILDVLDGIFLFVVEKHLRFRVAIEQSGVIVCPSVDVAVMLFLQFTISFDAYLFSVTRHLNPLFLINAFERIHHLIEVILAVFIFCQVIGSPCPCFIYAHTVQQDIILFLDAYTGHIVPCNSPVFINKDRVVERICRFILQDMSDGTVKVPERFLIPDILHNLVIHLELFFFG